MPPNRGGCLNLLRQIKPRRINLRLGVTVAALWFVFWTFSYVLRPYRSENAPTLAMLPLTTQIALVVAFAFIGPWLVSGFRPDRNSASRLP